MYCNSVLNPKRDCIIKKKERTFFVKYELDEAEVKLLVVIRVREFSGTETNTRGVQSKAFGQLFNRGLENR